MDLLSESERACPDAAFRLLFGKNERVSGQDLDPAFLIEEGSDQRCGSHRHPSGSHETGEGGRQCGERDSSESSLPSRMTLCCPAHQDRLRGFVFFSYLLSRSAGTLCRPLVQKGGSMLNARNISPEAPVCTHRRPAAKPAVARDIHRFCLFFPHVRTNHLPFLMAAKGAVILHHHTH